MRRLRRAHQKYLKEQNKKRNRFRQKALAAGTAAAIAFGAGVTLNRALANPPDPHELAVPGDTDADLLADSEEILIGGAIYNPDQDGNGVLDGVQLAVSAEQAIQQLPWQNEVTDPNQTYKFWYPQYGYVTCEVCGQDVVMGPGGVVNPRLGITVDFPFNLALHYMQHGSFAYSLDPSYRVDVPALIRALELSLPFDPNSHQMPVEGDSDSDLLSNREETSIGYQPFKPDQNRNEVPDGVELARRCAASVWSLPIGPPPDPNRTYRIEHALRGQEQCHICGQWIHMGGWEIFNPKLNLRYPDPNDPMDTMFLPDLALHFMEHGSFDCLGDIHIGRVEIDRLLRVLEMRLPYETNDHQLPLDYVSAYAGKLAPDANDLDGDLLADTEELKADFNLYDADQDDDLALDGIELAKQCKLAIEQLPDGPQPDPNQPYKLLYETDGLETCEVCGLTIPMDYWDIINPRLGLLINVPVMTAHYMEHGSFSFDATEHQGRIDIPLLLKILEMPQQCGDLGTVYRPGDTNKDCRVDGRDFAYFADRWLKETYPQND